ncbi:MAG: 23S rRNA (uracil(1939)-C(5))-methyltransferase RlmD [Clostridiales bacterium]|nr:23S rRNA (uracil(1939)-C(5))-methyltransferase RlmD [Clostridiales bacterium]
MNKKDENLIVGQVCELNINDLDMQGRGVSHYNNYTIFVENALPTEIVKAQIINAKGNIIVAKTLEVLKVSKFRKIPKCQYFNICGGCDLQHLNYNETLKFKKQQILIALKKIANINYSENNIDVIGCHNQYYYRNKVTFQVNNVNGVANLSFYEKQSHKHVNILDCKICDKKIKVVINLINEYFKTNKLSAYNEREKSGLIKNVVVRILNDEILLTFVTIKKTSLVNIKDLFECLKNHFKNVGINININKSNREILSNNFIHVIGKDKITFENLGLNQNITNASFLQVNLEIQNLLYNYVLTKLSDKVINAYSGAGLLTCLIAKNIKNETIIGIELNKEASMLADKLKKENKITNVINVCSDANKEIEKYNLENITLVVDPPRSGLSNEFINSILQSKPNKIVYISCSYQTLSKNLKELLKEYNIEEIKAFDMFPQTKNVETVVTLIKK